MKRFAIKSKTIKKEEIPNEGKSINAYLKLLRKAQEFTRLNAKKRFISENTIAIINETTEMKRKQEIISVQTDSFTKSSLAIESSISVTRSRINSMNASRAGLTHKILLTKKKIQSIEMAIQSLISSQLQQREGAPVVSSNEIHQTVIANAYTQLQQLLPLSLFLNSQSGQKMRPFISALMVALDTAQQLIAVLKKKKSQALSEDRYALIDQHFVKDCDIQLSEVCPICCEHFLESQLVKELKCKHVFHKNCLWQWVSIKGICPVCRRNI